MSSNRASSPGSTQVHEMESNPSVATEVPNTGFGSENDSSDHRVTKFDDDDSDLLSKPKIKTQLASAQDFYGTTSDISRDASRHQSVEAGQKRRNSEDPSNTNDDEEEGDDDDDDDDDEISGQKSDGAAATAAVTTSNTTAAGAAEDDIVPVQPSSTSPAGGDDDHDAKKDPVKIRTEQEKLASEYQELAKLFANARSVRSSEMLQALKKGKTFSLVNKVHERQSAIFDEKRRVTKTHYDYHTKMINNTILGEIRNVWVQFYDAKNRLQQDMIKEVGKQLDDLEAEYESYNDANLSVAQGLVVRQRAIDRLIGKPHVESEEQDAADRDLEAIRNNDTEYIEKLTQEEEMELAISEENEDLQLDASSSDPAMFPQQQINGDGDFSHNQQHRQHFQTPDHEQHRLKQEEEQQKHFEHQQYQYYQHQQQLQYQQMQQMQYQQGVDHQQYQNQQNFQNPQQQQFQQQNSPIPQHPGHGGAAAANAAAAAAPPPPPPPPPPHANHQGQYPYPYPPPPPVPMTQEQQQQMMAQGYNPYMFAGQPGYGYYPGHDNRTPGMHPQYYSGYYQQQHQQQHSNQENGHPSPGGYMMPSPVQYGYGQDGQTQQHYSPMPGQPPDGRLPPGWSLVPMVHPQGGVIMVPSPPGAPVPQPPMPPGQPQVSTKDEKKK